MAKLETRKKIMLAAEKLFSENGYDGVATKVIAKEAGVTEMTLFNHFKNKKLLYKTVVKERYLATEIESIFSKLTFEDIESDLLLIADKLLMSFFENKNILMMRLKEKENFSKDADFKLKQDPVFMQIKPVFETYKEKELIHLEDNETVELFMATLKGLFYVCLLEDKDEDAVRKIVIQYVRVFCNGITR